MLAVAGAVFVASLMGTRSIYPGAYTIIYLEHPNQ
jgi:hypothetical protein